MYANQILRKHIYCVGNNNFKLARYFTKLVNFPYILNSKIIICQHNCNKQQRYIRTDQHCRVNGVWVLLGYLLSVHQLIGQHGQGAKSQHTKQHIIGVDIGTTQIAREDAEITSAGVQGEWRTRAR